MTSVFLEQPVKVKRPSMKLWGGIEGAAISPYRVRYFVQGRTFSELDEADRRAIVRRLNKDRPAREIGTGWQVFLHLSHVMLCTSDGTDEREFAIYGGPGVVGTLALIFGAEEDEA